MDVGHCLDLADPPEPAMHLKGRVKFGDLRYTGMGLVVERYVPMAQPNIIGVIMGGTGGL